MKYIFGPVPSRRLGRSLGIDPIPSKTCNYQCIYCQLGKTNNFTNTRENFFPKDDIIAEMDKAIKLNKERFDYLTFVGSGEPTLYKDLKDLILQAKKISKKPSKFKKSYNLGIYLHWSRTSSCLSDAFP